MSAIRIGVVTVSDRASSGIYQDESGPAIETLMQEWLSCEYTVLKALVPDEWEAIHKALTDFSDQKECCLIVTTGGTGPAARDITPDVTEAVCEKMMPGFGELMRMNSLKYVPTAILSRQTAGIRGKSLIINLPGKPKSIRECLEVVFPAVPYCIDLLEGPFITTHEEQMKVFRPKSKQA